MKDSFNENVMFWKARRAKVQQWEGEGEPNLHICKASQMFPQALH